MNNFNNFSNYEELFRSLSYSDIMQLCQSNRQFQNICRSSRIQQIIKTEIIPNEINHILNKTDLIYVEEVLNNSIYIPLIEQKSSKTIRELNEQYNNLKIDIIVKILQNNPHIQNPVLEEIKMYYSTSAKIKQQKFVTHYTPTINQILNIFYSYVNNEGAIYHEFISLLMHIYRNIFVKTPIANYRKNLDKLFLLRNPQLIPIIDLAFNNFSRDFQVMNR